MKKSLFIFAFAVIVSFNSSLVLASDYIPPITMGYIEQQVEIKKLHPRLQKLMNVSL